MNSPVLYSILWGVKVGQNEVDNLTLGMHSVLWTTLDNFSDFRTMFNSSANLLP